MTKTEAIDSLCQLAREQVGYKEGADNYNVHAADPLVKEALGWDAQNQPWCAVFVVWLFIRAFGFYAGCHMMYGCSALCRSQAEFYRENAAYYSAPQKGDQIFFFVGSDINHTGVVVDVTPTTITTVEGNSSDSVAERTYYINDLSIAGYGRPSWEIVADDPDDPEGKREYPELQYLDGMNAPMATVKAWQQLLLCWGYDLGRCGADGEFGVITQQRTKDFQKRTGLDQTGIVKKDEWEQIVCIPVR